MCPTNWTLPRRPRKPWHELYFGKLKRETLENQKRWDGILLQCASELEKGDHLNKIGALSFLAVWVEASKQANQSIFVFFECLTKYRFCVSLCLETEKLVKKGLHVNYCSSVVCERNSLLNLAVIDGRKNVVRWLVEEKGADIETYDRGQFTPLLNAAYSGDRYLVVSRPTQSAIEFSCPRGFALFSHAKYLRTKRFFMTKGADRTKIGLSHYSKGLAPPQFKGLTAEGWAMRQGHDQIARLIREGL